MNIEELKNEYQKRQEIRDDLQVAKEELISLKKDDTVGRYVDLSDFIAKYQEYDKTNEQLLDELIAGVKIEDEEDIYFCFGRNFDGLPKKIGGYYIVDQRPFHGAVKVSWYQNINNEKDKIIIPSTDSAAFEENHKVYYHLTDEPMEEYKNWRRSKFLKKFRNLEKGYVKELKK